MKKIIFFLIFLFVFSSGVVLQSWAFVMPSVYVQNLVVNKSEFGIGETIESSFTVFNADTTVVPGIIYKAQIMGEIIDGVPSILAYEKSSTDKITVVPGDKIQKSFSLALPEGLAGDFVFRIALVNDQGLPLGWQDKEITISGLSDFVIIRNHFFLKDGEEFLPGGGTRYITGEIPQVKFLLSNNSSESLNLIPRIKIYERNIESKFIQEYNADALNVPANSDNNYFLNLPPMERPEVYLASMALYNEAGKLSSNQVFFRWVITGEGANIWQATTDKTFYQAGEDAKVQIIYTGSADDEFSVGEGVLEVKIYDQAGNLAGESNQTINLDKGGQLNVAVNINQDVDLPLIKTRIIKGEKIFADYGVSLAPQRPELIEKTSLNGLISKIIGVVILAVLIFLWLRRRIGGGKTLGALMLLIFVFATGMIFFTSQAHANGICEDCGGGSGTGVVWNSPQHGNIYKAGQNTITFSGGVWVGACGDALWNNHIDFYITDINGQNKYVLETDHSLPNIPCCGGGSAVYWNSTFSIPSDIPIQGEARAYISFHGQHWASSDQHWHWARVYEHIYIEKNLSPTATISCDSSSCQGYKGASGGDSGSLKLSYSATDPDNNIQSCQFQVDGVLKSTLCDSQYYPTIDLGIDLGNHSAAMTATDTNGLTDTKSTNFYIKEDIHANFHCSLNIAGPFSDCASVNPSPNVTVYFQDKSTLSEGATSFNQWQWTFQNGNPASSNEQNPNIIFTQSGANDVTLTVTDNQNRTDSVTRSVSIKSKLKPWWREIIPR